MTCPGHHSWITADHGGGFQLQGLDAAHWGMLGKTGINQLANPSRLSQWSLLSLSGHDFSAVTQGLSGATAMCRVKLNVIFLVVGTVALSDRSNTESRAFCQLKSDCNSQSVYKRIKARYRISDRGIIRTRQKMTVN